MLDTLTLACVAVSMTFLNAMDVLVIFCSIRATIAVTKSIVSKNIVIPWPNTLRPPTPKVLITVTIKVVKADNKTKIRNA
ncbi:hypothetical protein ES703_100476 [subsurface metagenome]